MLEQQRRWWVAETNWRSDGVLTDGSRLTVWISCEV